MYKGKTVCVVVPAYNEENLIGSVIDTMPEFVDRIVVVDDLSKDSTAKVVKGYENSLKGRLTLIEHDRNEGVGGAIATGYKWARDNEMDITCVMAGDGQMDPSDLPNLLDPVANNEVDYAKGNRLFSGDAFRVIPKFRYFGNSALSLLTKIASGYWHIADSQSGYTATSLEVLQSLDLDKIYKRFGMPNDMLVKLNIYSFRVRDISITPVYNIGEKSGIRIWKVIFSISFLLLKRFFWRMKEKYVIRDFHPLIFFYGLAFSLLALSFPLLGRLIYFWAITGNIPKVNALALMFALIAGLQSLFFAMWFDMENNKDLK
ncbi:MAG: glycosyltransferase family 2 protein [Candidatus Zixiibacteriota bacterium]